MDRSTPTIKKLSPQLTALIAAGEVVERPASVVKELVENALDAGAKAVNVEVGEGGLSLIRVGDDGHGMSRVDAPLALQAFTTSKVEQAADLNAIRTYGFRGEALSSLAAIAAVEILTRSAEELEGTRLVWAGHPQADPVADLTILPAASPVGTQVTVRQLFAATPARRKFLKSPLRELELIQQTLERYALGHPQTAFRLMADGRVRLALPPGSLPERVGALWGREMADEMMPIEWEALDLRVRGLISKPTVGRSRRDREYFFVNGRPIRAGLLAVMLERPYAGLLPPGRYPLAVVFIEIDPAFVDANVHPQKAEVRFSRERSVYGALSQAVSRALIDFPRQMFDGEDLVNWPFAGVTGSMGAEGQLREGEVAYQGGSLRPLAQIHQTYILAQAAEGVLIIDQHAAHEQILYERLTGHVVEPAAVGPLQISLTRAEATLLSNSLSVLAALGFDAEMFGRQAALLRTIPAILQPHLSHQVARTNQPFEAILLTTLLEELQTNQALDPDAQRDKVAQKAACVCAVKAGDTLSSETMQQLLNDLVETWSPAACPHGRPVFVSLSLEEIERRFGRR